MDVQVVLRDFWASKHVAGLSLFGRVKMWGVEKYTKD
jgi:hypothetical protein